MQEIWCQLHVASCQECRWKGIPIATGSGPVSDFEGQPGCWRPAERSNTDQTHTWAVTDCVVAVSSSLAMVASKRNACSCC